MHVLLEALNKLGDENILSLSGNGGTLKEKDTVTPLARAQINTAYSYLLRVERQVEEERERRERQEPGVTIHTRTDDAVFEGRSRVKEMKLNDFITMELDGRGALDANRDLLLDELLKEPHEVYPRCGSIG
ncbi:retrotransposon hot spot (RHS) protein [Trypanosoma cruzi]|nr:retrotransposon hot spot (RHS) protein [Trypanosoma cruzi]